MRQKCIIFWDKFVSCECHMVFLMRGMEPNAWMEWNVINAWVINISANIMSISLSHFNYPVWFHYWKMYANSSSTFVMSFCASMFFFIWIALFCVFNDHIIYICWSIYKLYVCDWQNKRKWATKYPLCHPICYVN